MEEVADGVIIEDRGDGGQLAPLKDGVTLDHADADGDPTPIGEHLKEK